MYTGSNILHWKMAIDENGRVEYTDTTICKKLITAIKAAIWIL